MSTILESKENPQNHCSLGVFKLYCCVMYSDQPCQEQMWMFGRQYKYLVRMENYTYTRRNL